MKFTKILLPIVSSAILAIPPLTMTTSCSNNKSLDDYSWEEIKELSKSGEASKLFKVGDTKKVQLKTQDSNNNGRIDEGEVYQTVRIIGFDQDYDRNVKRIGITFEFADRISDSLGFSLATYWNDYKGENKDFTNGLNYINSSVRKALIGDLAETKTQLNWFGYYGDFPFLNQHFIKDDDPYYNMSVMDMLPDDLKASITPAYKIVNICTKNPEWSAAGAKITPPEFEQVQFVLDPLFLLSPCEIGWEDEGECFQEPFQTTYQYYAGVGRESKKHAKAQLNKNTKHDSPIEALDGNFKPIEGIQTSPYSYAGCATTETNDNAHWLRSPSNFTTTTAGDTTLATVRPCAWAVKEFSGLILDYYIRGRAYGIAPAFCI